MTPDSTTFTTASLNGIKLHRLTWGDPSNPPLVLLHGGGANAHWWDHLAPTLARSFAVTALDFRGHGCSDFPESVTDGGFSHDLDALLEDLGTNEVVLVGHSMGARVALEHAARDASIRALVLIDIARGASPRDRRRGRLALSLRRSYATRHDAVSRYRFLPEARHISPALRDAIAEHSVREEPDGRFSFRFDPRWFGVGSRPPPNLEAVACPTLILRGEESEFLTEEGLESLCGGIRRAHAQTIPRAGHHLQLDQPEAALNAICEFLSGLSDEKGTR